MTALTPCHECGAPAQRERDGFGACARHTLPSKTNRRQLRETLASARPSSEPKFSGPSDIAAACADLQTAEQEHLRVFLLNTKNQIIRWYDLYIGTMSSVDVRTGEVFREAVRANAAHIAVAHNHPSGDPTPSPEDVRLTRHLMEAGKLLDIDVLDHVVIGRGPNAHVSIRGTMQP